MTIGIIKHRSPHSQKLERWLGAEKIEHLQQTMRGWYGRPIHLLDVPGSIRISADGDFYGEFKRGVVMSALDEFEARLRYTWKNIRPHYGFAGAGFASISDALSRSSQGYSQRRMFNKVGPTGVVGGTSSLWRLGNQPAAGSSGDTAPGGTAHSNGDSTGAGGLAQVNPASGTLHLVGADVSASVINNSLLLYDRIYSVAKTMSSTATEAVTGTPSRYQSTVNTDPDYAGDNFLFIEVGAVALAATAHNWTVCTYTDQDGSASTLPSVTGNSGAIIHRLDQPLQQWFAPLQVGDVGIRTLTQMQCSASITGSINFVIGHPLGFMAFPVINSFFPFDWLTNRDQAPRIFDGAVLALLEPLKPATTATTYTGRIALTSAAA